MPGERKSGIPAAGEGRGAQDPTRVSPSPLWAPPKLALTGGDASAHHAHDVLTWGEDTGVNPKFAPKNPKTALSRQHCEPSNPLRPRRTPPSPIPLVLPPCPIFPLPPSGSWCPPSPFPAPFPSPSPSPSPFPVSLQRSLFRKRLTPCRLSSSSTGSGLSPPSPRVRDRSVRSSSTAGTSNCPQTVAKVTPAS